MQSSASYEERGAATNRLSINEPDSSAMRLELYRPPMEEVREE